MSSAVTTTPGGLVVVAQVFPSNQPQPQEVQSGGPRLQRFMGTYPQVVGSLQIVIGIFVPLSGVVMVIQRCCAVSSGFIICSAVFYITSGSLTVAAGKSLSRCLINTAMGFNVVSSVAAFSAICLYSFDDVGETKHHWSFDSPSLSLDYSVILLVFHILEFSISITVIFFACRSTCSCCSCCDDQQHPYVYFTSAQAPPYTVPATMAVPPRQIFSCPVPTENQDQIFPGLPEPPAYTP